MKNKIDQYLAANVFDNEKPSSLTLHGGDQLQEEINHLYEDVIGPEFERLEQQVSELTKHGKRYTDFSSQAQQIEELKRENEKLRGAFR